MDVSENLWKSRVWFTESSLYKKLVAEYETNIIP